MRTTLILGCVCVILAAGLVFPGCKDQEQAQAGPQTTCPLMGGKIDKNIYVDHEGKRVYFCCSGCTQKFKEEPEKYIKKMEDAGVILEKAPD